MVNERVEIHREQRLQDARDQAEHFRAAARRQDAYASLASDPRHRMEHHKTARAFREKAAAFEVEALRLETDA